MSSSIMLPALAPFFPGIVTARFFATWDFYTTHLDFGTVFESNDELRLVHASGVQLAVLREETEAHVAELVSATTGRGLWLTLDVADADAVYSKMLDNGVEMASPVEETSAGERRFAVRDPNGILIFIVQKLAAQARAEAEGRRVAQSC